MWVTGRCYHFLTCPEAPSPFAPSTQLGIFHSSCICFSVLDLETHSTFIAVFIVCVCVWGVTLFFLMRSKMSWWGTPFSIPPKLDLKRPSRRAHWLSVRISATCLLVGICGCLTVTFKDGQICRHTLRDLGFLILSSFPSSSVKMRTLD